MSDAGFDFDVNNVTITLDDTAPPLPDVSAIRPGTYAPANHFFGSPANDVFPGPAPPGPDASTLSAFEGLDPNGTWSLYVRDDGAADTGSIDGGWSLHLWNISAACCDPPVSLGVARMGNNLQLTWPAAAAAYSLEAKNELNPALTWDAVMNAVVISNGLNVVTVPVGPGNRYFRLKK
jgi:hypothetical protein